MSNKVSQQKLALMSFLASLCIVGINLGTGIVLYAVVIKPALPDSGNPHQETTDYDIETAYEESVQSSTPVATNNEQDTAAISRLIKTAPTRSPSTPIIIGAPPQPISITTSADNKPIYHWCSGKNPDLPDGVCKSIISIASNPTESNPYLSPQVIQWLTLLPPNSTMTIDESSWVSKTTGTGEIGVVLQTASFGNIPLLISLEFNGTIWVVMEGKSA
jgi:cytoskeletal protein RodZ